MEVVAIVKTLSGGYEMDQARIKEYGFKIGDRHVLSNVSMGQSNTTIRLKGFDTSFNSVFFSFEEDGEEINIFADQRFNPYL